MNESSVHHWKAMLKIMFFFNIEMKQMPTEIIQKTKLLLQHTNEHQVSITQEILFEKYLGH